MKKSHYFLIIIFLFVIISCNKDNNNEPVSKNRIDSYFYGYMFYPYSVMLNSDTDNLVKFEYIGDKIVKRTGNILATFSGAQFTDILYEELSYSNNQITIITKVESENITTDPNNRIIYLDNRKRMTQKTFEDTSRKWTDTINYEYDNNDRIIKSIKNSIEPSVYYYNNNNNLDSIVTYLWDNKKQIQIFSGYDNSTNPLKSLWIFKETFHRSLSENNYSIYQSYEYDSDNNLISQHEGAWLFIYDNDGNIDYSKH